MHSRVNEMSKQINCISYQHDIELQQKLMVHNNISRISFVNQSEKILTVIFSVEL